MPSTPYQPDHGHKQKHLHSFLAVLFLVSVFWGCSRQNADYRPPANITEVQQALANRIISGDTVPVSKEVLLRILPERPEGFFPLTTTGSVFLTRNFSSLQRLYRHPDGYTLKVTLADYAADSAGFLFLFRRYERQRDSLMISPPEGLPNGSFVWMPEDSTSQTTQLEAGLYNRYHISCSGKIPQSKPVFEKIVSDISRNLPGESTYGKK
ncbi:MAG: hypothetical protein R3D00_08040 [Bacteroidia bacterium]